MNYHGLKPVVSGSIKSDSASASLRATFIPSFEKLGFSGKGDNIYFFFIGYNLCQIIPARCKQGYDLRPRVEMLNDLLMHTPIERERAG